MGALRGTGRALVVSAVLATAAVATASPSGAVPRHTSCKGYGQLVASEAHDRTFGDEMVPPFCTPK